LLRLWRGNSSPCLKGYSGPAYSSFGTLQWSSGRFPAVVCKKREEWRSPGAPGRGGVRANVRNQDANARADAGGVSEEPSNSSNERDRETVPVVRANVRNDDADAHGVLKLHDARGTSIQ
jgi:hypothetical protein